MLNTWIFFQIGPYNVNVPKKVQIFLIRGLHNLWGHEVHWVKILSVWKWDFKTRYKGQNSLLFRTLENEHYYKFRHPMSSKAKISISVSTFAKRPSPGNLELFIKIAYGFVYQDLVNKASKLLVIFQSFLFRLIL